MWDTYDFMFEECGFELYEWAVTTYSTKELYEEIGAPAKGRLGMNTLLLLVHLLLSVIY